MVKSSTPPDSLSERIQQRGARAEHYSADRPKWQQGWSRFHLGVANMIDGIYTLKGSGAVAGFAGGFIGFFQGAFYTGVAFMGIALLGLASPIGITAGALVGGVIYGTIQAARFYGDARQEMTSKDGAYVADDFAKKHNVIAGGVSKGLSEALSDLHRETHKTAYPEVTDDEMEEMEERMKERKQAFGKDRPLPDESQEYSR